MKIRTETNAALLLALLAVIAATTACGDAAETKTETQTTTAAVKDTADGTEYVDPRLAYADVAPAVEDFGGYEFRMAVTAEEAEVFNQVAYWSEGENGDTLNDAIFRRNLAVEEAYNITISLIALEDTDTTVRKNIQAADDFADIIFMHSIDDVLSYAQQGCFFDLYSVEELQLDQQWWDQRMQEDLTIYNMIFCATGDISIRDELREMAVLYNKALYTEYDYLDPYEYVANGTWTWETMSSMVRDVTKDLNGDGALTVLDQWGLMSETVAGWYLFLGSGRDSIKLEGDDYISDIEDEKIYNIFENIFELMLDKKSVIIMNDGSHDEEFTTGDVWKEATKIFSENRALFRTGTFGDTVDLRNMKTDFGILPIPMIDEGQDAYYCMCSDDISPLVIPTTAPDIHKTALITEALAFESMFSLTPSFYEVFLDEKILRDEKSKEMIDILFDSKVYSLDYIADLTGLPDAVGDMVDSGNNKLASKAAALQKSAQKKVTKFFDKFADLE